MDLLKEMRKTMDELKNAIKEKTNRSLDRMVRRIDSPFTMVVLECPVPLKFLFPWITSTLSRRLWVSSSPMTRYYVVLFPLLLKE